jgi:hypothetical protein
MTKEEAEAYLKSPEYLDAPLDLPCPICDTPFQTTHRKLGDYSKVISCGECEVQRAKDPGLFDYLLRVMEGKIDRAIRSHTDCYDHNTNYDDR